MHTEPAIMQNNDRNANSAMPDRLYGEHYPDSFLDVSRPIRESSVATLGDYIQQLQEINGQPNQSCFACEPSKSGQTTYDHICPNNPILTCNCADPKYCAELGSDPDGATTQTEGTRTEEGRDGNKRCPESGRVCNERVCPQECLGDKDGFSDNLEYTGIPIPTPKRESEKLGWPCIVVGAIPETWVDSAECVSRSPDSSGFAK
jgi:hypothetical protein